MRNQSFQKTRNESTPGQTPPRRQSDSTATKPFRTHNTTRKLIYLLALWIAVVGAILPPASSAQKQRNRTLASGREPAHSSHVSPPPIEVERIDLAMSAICTDRGNDPKGSIPIDEMQQRASLQMTNPNVVEGEARAERLLPLAREFVVEAIRDLGRQHSIESWRIGLATDRVRLVTKIKPDIDLRDNASVYYQNRRAIHFGTIFLASLQSDEGMISILAHELTHIGDGRSGTLHPLFKAIGARATLATGLQIEGARPEELTCDLVGVIAARKLIDKVPGDESLLRRLSRSIEHNCVARDETDDVHLSPRNTMRAVLALEPLLAKTATTERN